MSWQFRVGGYGVLQSDLISHIILVRQQIFKIFKLQMSSVEYHRLALQQYLRYQAQLDQYLALSAQVEELKAKISARHKKHRRCDKEITKGHKCCHCEKYYASDIALKLHLKLKHKAEEKICASSTEDSHAGEQYSNEAVSPNQLQA